MASYGMVIDISRCTACYGCFVACKDEHWDNDYAYSAAQPRLGQHWIDLKKRERGRYPHVRAAYMPILCQQCDDPPCARVAEMGTVRKEPNGVVVIDPGRAAGQRQIVDACPYNAVFWNEERQLPQKCTFCAHRLDAGRPPRCVQMCPSGCITFGDLSDPDSDVSRLLKSSGGEVFHPEWNTLPRVRYIGLERITGEFIAGAVVLGDVDECGVGATVSLTCPDGSASTTAANGFGEFEFDGLKAGFYSLRIEVPGYTPAAIDVGLKSAEYLGDITLLRR